MHANILELMGETMPMMKLPWLFAVGANEDETQLTAQITLSPIEVAADVGQEHIRNAADARQLWQTLMMDAFAKSSEAQLRMMRQVLKAANAAPKPKGQETAWAMLHPMLIHYFGLAASVNQIVLWLIDQPEIGAKRPPAPPPTDVPEPSIQVAPETIKTDPEITNGEATPQATSEPSTVTDTEPSPSGSQSQLAG